MIGTIGNVLGGLFGAFLVLVAIAAYMVPTVVGGARKVVNIGSVCAINVLLGWTLIGWAVALAMALRTNPPGLATQLWPGRATPAPPAATAPAPATAGAAPPPGWYLDPSGARRWWDGREWTAATQTPAQHPLPGR